MNSITRSTSKAPVCLRTSETCVTYTGVCVCVCVFLQPATRCNYSNSHAAPACYTCTDGTGTMYRLPFRFQAVSNGLVHVKFVRRARGDAVDGGHTVAVALERVVT